nr:unnamed protein product [Callosobruchus chinensis]
MIKYEEDDPVNPSQQDLTLPITTSPSSEIPIEKAAATDKIQLDTNDPVSWLPLTDHIRCFLVEKGPDQGKSHEKTGEGLSKEILEKLEVDGLNIQDLRDQGYDNGSNMAAKNIMDQINYKFICTLQIWDNILESVDKVNVALQSKTMTIDKASELIKGLTSQIQNIRETVDIVFEKAKRICEQCDIEDNFPEKRRKRIKRHDLSESSDTGYDISQQQSFKIQINEAIDTIISELKWRFEKLRDIQNSFGFLTLKHITAYSVEELKKHAADLSIKYSADINATEFWSEIETLKSQVEATTLFDKCECQSSMGLLKAIVELDLKEMFPNVVVAIKIFLTMPVTVASCERSFSKLKLIKTYLRSTMGQEKLSGLAILSIEGDIARLLSYENVIKNFAMRKARKINL